MFHKYHVMEAFHLKSNADLVIFALQHDLISLPPRGIERKLEEATVLVPSTVTRPTGKYDGKARCPSH